MRLAITSAVLVLACGVARADGPADPSALDPSAVLDAYMRRPQPAYAWTTKSTEVRGGVTLHRLELTSQTWRGMLWKHRLNVVVPQAATGSRARPGHAVLALTGSGGEDEMLAILAALAERIGVPVAVLHDVPNQPLMPEASENGRGLREDALIAQTFVEFMKTGDRDWPILLPMTRAASSAMDALGELSEREAAREGSGWAFGKLDKFITTGASKRGWTTWLTGIVEPRVVGIAPIVYDNLNVGAQLRRHMEVWGHPSPMIHDYTDRGLLAQFETARGLELMRIVDPYQYRDRLALPKMALMGTNDTYWPLDGVNLYRSDLPGDLYCHYVPNAGHSAGLSVVDAVSGFFDFVTHRIDGMPIVSIAVSPRREAVVSVESPARGQPREHDRRLQDGVRRSRVWCARVEGRDFTKATWVKVDASSAGERAWSAPLPESLRLDAGGGSAAFIGEVELLDSSGAPFLLHTPVQVWELGPRN